MGCYTSVMHPKTRQELQIKTGWDVCEWYSVGDRVEFTPDSNSGCGRLYDGAYKSSEGPWVIIRGGRILEVVEAEKDEAVSEREVELEKKYGLVESRDNQKKRAWLRCLSEPIYDQAYVEYKVTLTLSCTARKGEPITARRVAEKLMGDPRFIKIVAKKMGKF